MSANAHDEIYEQFGWIQETVKQVRQFRQWWSLKRTAPVEIIVHCDSLLKALVIGKELGPEGNGHHMLGTVTSFDCSDLKRSGQPNKSFFVEVWPSSHTL